MVKLLENLSPKGPRGTEDPEARRARWFIDPSDRNELYHPTLLSKIWDLRKLIIWWMVPLMKYYTHTLHTRVKELKIYPHSSAFPLSYFSQPAPDGCIAYCLCFGILDQFVWENSEWNILLFVLQPGTVEKLINLQMWPFPVAAQGGVRHEGVWGHNDWHWGERPCREWHPPA